MGSRGMVARLSRVRRNETESDGPIQPRHAPQTNSGFASDVPNGSGNANPNQRDFLFRRDVCSSTVQSNTPVRLRMRQQNGGNPMGVVGEIENWDKAATIETGGTTPLRQMSLL